VCARPSMRPRLLSLDCRDLERILRNGFTLSRTRGSHRQFVGFVREQKKRVTVIAKRKRFTPKTLASMIQRSGLTEEEWLQSI